MNLNSLLMSLQVIETCKGKQIGNTHYKIELIDTNPETDINISQELVAREFARPSRELAEVQTTFLYPISFYRPQTKFAKVMFLQVSGILSTGGGACVVARGGACVVALGGGHAWLLGGGMRGCSGGCAWLLWGGVRGCSGGGSMHGCSGGHVWLLGGRA